MFWSCTYRVWSAVCWCCDMYLRQGLYSQTFNTEPYIPLTRPFKDIWIISLQCSTLSLVIFGLYLYATVCLLSIDFLVTPYGQCCRLVLNVIKHCGLLNGESSHFWLWILLWFINLVWFPVEDMQPLAKWYICVHNMLIKNIIVTS